MVRLLSGQSQSMGKKGAKSIFRLVPLLGPYFLALALKAHRCEGKYFFILMHARFLAVPLLFPHATSLFLKKKIVCLTLFPSSGSS